MLPLPQDLAGSNERYQFLLFGDSRAGHSRCDKQKKHSCKLVLPGGARPTAQDCMVEERAPDLMLETITTLLQARTAPQTKRQNTFALFTNDLIYRDNYNKD